MARTWGFGSYGSHMRHIHLDWTYFPQANPAREPMRLGVLRSCPSEKFTGASVSEKQPKKDDHRNWHTQQPEQYASTHVLLHIVVWR
jgi:hypothetical protein